MSLCIPHVDLDKNNRVAADELLMNGLNCSNPENIVGSFKCYLGPTREEKKFCL